MKKQLAVFVFNLAHDSEIRKAVILVSIEPYQMNTYEQIIELTMLYD